MRPIFKNLIFLACACAAVLISIGAIGCYTHPQTTYDALATAEKFSEPSPEYRFEYIEPDHYMTISDSLEISIDKSKFAESMSRKTVRVSSDIYKPVNLVDPDNEYVKTITEYLEDISEDWNDYNRITLALNFVQTAIIYDTDTDVYGMEEFWAAPIETLYLHRGDCEDQAILLCSIYGAMGYDWYLLSYPQHISVGVNLNGTFYYCEPTSNIATLPLPFNPRYDESPKILDKTDDGIVSCWLTAFSIYR